jgi:hypothetical protein
VVFDRDAARADTLAADLGDRALAASGDVNDDEAVAAAPCAAMARHTRWRRSPRRWR